MPEEIPLGGNLQAAVRIGDTVHRRAGPWTPAVHALLRYLEGVGFPAPRVIGMDGQGREVLRYIAGEAYPDRRVAEEPPKKAEAHLVEAAKLLRRYHDVIASFRPPPGAHWRLIAPTRYELICHNDWAPWNALLVGGRVSVMTDWDLTGPGDRLRDVCNAVYCWAPLIALVDVPIDVRVNRMRMFLDAYDLADRSALLLTLRQRLYYVADFIDRAAAAGDSGMRNVVGMSVPRNMRDLDIAFLDRNWATLQRAL